MKEWIVQDLVIDNTPQYSDQFSVNENVPEVTLMLDYTKDDETGLRVRVEYAPNADGDWYLMSDTSGVGVNTLIPWTVQMTATGIMTFPLKITNYGFYRLVYWAENAVVFPDTYGFLSAHVIKDV